MQRLQQIIFILTFLITATTFGQVITDTPSTNTSEKNIITGIDENIAIKNSSTQNFKTTFEAVQKEMNLAVISIHGSAKKRALKSGDFIWNGKQWEINDTSITAPDEGMA